MQVEVEYIQTIDDAEMGYVGWPTLGRGRDGALFVAYSGGRRHHVCPFGQVHFRRSNDQGKTWSPPTILADSPLDERDGGIVCTAKGTIIVNWFTSLRWVLDMEQNVPKFTGYSDEEKAEWAARRALLNDRVQLDNLGVWCVRSTDGGRTWSQRIDSVVGSPHGIFRLRSGRLMQAGKRATNDVTKSLNASPFLPHVGVSVSDDDGQTWQFLSEIPPMPGHTSKDYHELHGVEAADGRIVVHIRNHNETFFREILQTESFDGGATWSTVRSTGLWGHPAFLNRTSEGLLMTTFGHRRPPRGNQIAVSDDHGKTWSAPLTINTDSAGDMGYPSTVEVAPGQFMSLWYDNHLARLKTTLRLARWRLH